MAGGENERRVTLEWSSGQAFSATSGSGHTVALDGDVASGQSPMEALLTALGGCMGIDVIHILEKMRTPPTALSLDVTGVRRESEPRAYRKISLRFRLTGDVAVDKAERAVELSVDKYCSVFHTLHRGIELETSIAIEPS